MLSKLIDFYVTKSFVLNELYFNFLSTHFVCGYYIFIEFVDLIMIQSIYNCH
jgi:hypothetical protein